MLAMGVAFALILMGVASAAPAPAAAGPCDGTYNKIACENSKPGSPASEWDITGSGDSSIQGFSTDISVNVGQRIDFKIDTTASAYTVAIYRIGYYQGNGARKIATVTPSAALPQRQPQCITDVTTELYDCGNWGVSASWNVPSDAVSGVYIALLKRTDNSDTSHITFVVRDDSSHSDITFQTSDPTWQAYNTYGGSDFYQGAANGRAYKISYNRPVLTRDGTGGRDFFFSNEYPAVRFLERNGYDVSYQSGVDTDRYGSLLLNHKVFLSVGHDEYWSGAQRANVEAARDAGVNLQFLSGNEIYWRTRYEPSADTSHTAYRTLVSYKETWANAKIDPSSEWTGTYRDPRFAPTSQGGGKPENALSGTIFMSNYTDAPVTVTKAQGTLRLWRNSGLASMTGTSTPLAPHTVGYESDEDQDNGARPPGLIRLSTTTAASDSYMQDFGSAATLAGTTTHSVTLYRAQSGALVFGAGSVQWTWGLDSNHDSAFAPSAADARMQQAQVNLLADMGAQPTTLMAGMVPATKSTDTVGPSVSITSPGAGSSQANGASVTVTGTAADTGGGVVAAVEYSADGGATWHPAAGTTSWAFTYTQHGSGTQTIRVRGVDDSANIGAVATRDFAVSCPCNVFGTATPSTAPISTAGVTSLATTDPSAVELGMRFTPTTDTFATGVRFYKGTGNTGTHIGRLWSSSGQLLASVTFTGETATGWQTAQFSSIVPITAGSTYVVSYTAPNGHYAAQPDAFSSAGLVAPPLKVDGGYGAIPAGVYSNPGSFPNQSYQNTNYFVDVLVNGTDTTPLTVTNQWPLPGSTSVAGTTPITASYSKSIAAGSQKVVVTDQLGNTVTGTTTYDTSTRTVTFQPSQVLNGFVKYTVTVTGTDALGNPVSSGGSWSFTSAKTDAVVGTCPCSLFNDSTVPSIIDTGETQPVSVGVRFAPTQDGTITGMQFYKGPGNTGTHTGTLWSDSGTVLATGTFAGESTAGWQTLTFTQPVAVTAGSNYVVSYRSSTGSYPVTPGDFATADRSRGPLSVTSTAGRYTYSDAFPTQATSTNYFVDPIFVKQAPSVAVTAMSPASGATDVPTSSNVTAWFSSSIIPGATFTVAQGATSIAGSTVLSADGTQLTFTPSAALPADKDITVTLSGVVSTQGASLPTQTWTFHTSAPGNTVTQSLFSNQTPTEVSSSDNAAVELGTVWTPGVDGTVTGVRFYKGTGNGGTHTGSLWSMSGQRLATVTFAGETPTGWQTASFSSPVQVTADTSYIVSYLAPQGHYSDTPGFFNSPLTNGDLSAPSGQNGRYLYGAAGGFPLYTFNSTSYFVDVTFVAGTPVMAVSSQTPAPGATGVSTATKPSITFSAPLTTGWAMSVKAGATSVAGGASLSTDGRTLTFTPTAALPTTTSLTVTVTGINSTTAGALADQTWSFQTGSAATALVSMFPTQTPSTLSDSDTAAVELGTAFTPSVAGSVTAIKFYKGSGNTGTHTGSLWTSTGTILASVIFTGESANGWQTAQLATPADLVAGQTYVVSYFAPKGHYSSTGAFFNSPVTNGPLTAASTNNGRYRYGSTSGFPTSSWNATNYFVDVVFRYAP